MPLPTRKHRGRESTRCGELCALAIAHRLRAGILQPGQKISGVCKQESTREVIADIQTSVTDATLLVPDPRTMWKMLNNVLLSTVRNLNGPSLLDVDMWGLGDIALVARAFPVHPNIPMHLSI